MDDATKTQITDAIVEVLLDVCPDFSSVSMYSGTMVEIIKGDPKTQIGGFFVYKAHVSCEFSQGASLDDPKQLLEGSGKFRRHLKLRSVEDISAKEYRGFLKQAIAQV